MSDVSPEDIGRLKEAVDTLKKEVIGLRDEVSAVNKALSEIKGGKRVLWSLWSALGILAAVIGTYFTVRGQ